jgi:hypothetical protein
MSILFLLCKPEPTSCWVSVSRKIETYHKVCTRFLISCLATKPSTPRQYIIKPYTQPFHPRRFLTPETDDSTGMYFIPVLIIFLASNTYTPQPYIPRLYISALPRVFTQSPTPPPRTLTPESVGSSNREKLKNIGPAGEFDCKLCPKTFKGVRQLQRHMQLHTNPDKYKCTVEGCKKVKATKNINLPDRLPH